MTDKEAMQMALEVLFRLDEQYLENGRQIEVAEEIATLRAALAQPEPTVNGWPLHSGLPQREWVTLTSDETMLLANETSGAYWGTEKHLQAFKKAIEAKLKAKNGY